MFAYAPWGVSGDGRPVSTPESAVAPQEMPIFTRTYDLLAWLLPMTNHFPRPHRHTLTKRLLDAAFDLRERLESANLRRHAGAKPSS